MPIAPITFPAHPRADIMLISTKGADSPRQFRARRLNLAAASEFFDGLDSMPDLQPGETIDGLPALKVETTSDALAIVLALIHGTEVPNELSVDLFVVAYRLARMWIAPVVVERLIARLPKELATGTAGLYAANLVWDLAVQHEDEALLSLVAYRPWRDTTFIRKPLSFVSAFGEKAVLLSLVHLNANRSAIFHLLNVEYCRWHTNFAKWEETRREYWGKVVAIANLCHFTPIDLNEMAKLLGWMERLEFCDGDPDYVDYGDDEAPGPEDGQVCAFHLWRTRVREAMCIAKGE